MGLFKIAVPILCPCTAFFQGNCDQKAHPTKKCTTYRVHSSYKVKYQCCLTILPSYLENELLKLAFLL